MLATAASVPRRISDTVRVLFSGDPAGTPEYVREMSAAGDAGLFGPGSLVWRVHGNTATIVGGVRALLLQALEPRTLAGVVQHSRFREDPIGRLQNTARFVTVTTYGSTAMVERECAMVRRIHERVQGHTTDGRPYSATDPEQLRFVHLSLVESFLVAHQRCSADALDRAEQDAYVREMNRLAPLMGFDGVELPTDVATLRAMPHPTAAHMAITPDTRETLAFLAKPPLPAAQLCAYRALHRGALATLAPDHRALIGGGRSTPLDIPAAAALVQSLRVLLGESPARLAAQSRIAGETPVSD